VEEWLGRGAVEEFAYALANHLCAEEHALENGLPELADAIRQHRKQLLVEGVRALFDVDPRESRGWREGWCIVKHLLLAWYHLVELQLMLAERGVQLDVEEGELLQLAVRLMRELSEVGEREARERAEAAES